MTDTEGKRELEAAIQRLATAKKREAAAAKSLMSTKKTEESALKMVEVAKANAHTAKRSREVAETQWEDTKKEEEAQKFLQETEKRCEVIDVDDDSSPPPKKKRDLIAESNSSNVSPPAPGAEGVPGLPPVPAAARYPSWEWSKPEGMVCHRCAAKEEAVAEPETSGNVWGTSIPGVDSETVREKVKSIVESADKEELTVKGVRKLLEDWLDRDLSDHRDAIRFFVMEAV
ncbi:LOW QUALITY PROTEIN: hypothetical protein ACHAXT_012025 [Thalassiosira profunda]